jgi:tetratricopeptide (TPR) repeat protein
VTSMGNDALYGPCPCGSGKKLKFCCRLRAAPRQPAHEARVVEEAWARVSRGLYREVPPLLRPLLERGSTTVDGRMVLAIALCATLEFDAAAKPLMEIFETLSPGDRSAGGVLAHLRLLTGRRDEAEALVDRCLASPIRRAADAIHLLGPLALLGRDQAVLELPRHLSEPAPDPIVLGAAIAAANLGRRSEAEDLLGRIRDVTSPLNVAGLAAYLRGATGASPWPRLAPVPPDFAAPLMVAPAWLSGEATPGPLPPAVSEQLKHELRVVLVSVLSSDPMASPEALHGFTRLDPAVARAELAAVWEWPEGSATQAITAALVARDAGLVPDDTEVSLSVCGVLRRVCVGDLGLPPDFPRMPSHLDDRREEAVRLEANGEPARARKLYESILRELPEHPLVMSNLLAIDANAGEISDADRLRRLRALVEAAPRYVFARANLALELVRLERPDEAASVLNETHLLGAPAPQAYAHVAVALARIAMARDDRPGAARFAEESARAIGVEALATMAPDIVLLRRLLNFQRSMPPQRLARADRRLARRIAGDAPTEAWSALLTVDELKACIDVLGYRLPGPPRKAALARALTMLLEDPTEVRAHAERLRAGTAKEVLDTLLAGGGRMPFVEALDRFGGPSELPGPVPPWGQLVVRGLAMIATVDGVPSLAMPPAVVRALRPSPDAEGLREAPSVARDSGSGRAGRWEVVALQLPPIGHLQPTLGVVVDSEDGKVLASHVVEEGGAPLALSVALGKALGEVLLRPAALEVESDAGRDSLRAIAGAVPIERGPCARAREALEAFRREIPDVIERMESETWAGRGVSLTAARSFHEHAAALYRARPWDAVPDDGCAMRLTSSDGVLTGACAVVIGQARTSYGLLLHDDLTSWFRARRALAGASRDDAPPHLGLLFEREDGVPPSLSFEVRSHKLPLAGPAAFPWLLAVEAGGGSRTTHATDVARMELAMRAVTQVAERAGTQLLRWRSRAPKSTQVELGGVRVDVEFHTAVD